MSKKKTTKKKQDKIECLRCERNLVATSANYYLSENPLFSENVSRFPVCKKCINEYIGEKDSSGYIDRVILTLANLNKPYLQDLWEKSSGSWGNYIRQISSFPQYNGMDFSHSSFQTKVSIDSIQADSINNNEDTSSEESKNVQQRWIGYSDEDALFLENFYQELISTYPSDTPIQRNIYKNMAETQLMANKEISKGKIGNYRQLMNVMSKLMEDAKIKPVQEDSTEDGSLTNWGSWIKKIEEEEPIPEARDEFKDVDGIGKYINKWFTSHFAKVFGLTNVAEYEKENGFSEEVIDTSGDSDGKL